MVLTTVLELIFSTATLVIAVAAVVATVPWKYKNITDKNIITKCDMDVCEKFVKSKNKQWISRQKIVILIFHIID